MWRYSTSRIFLEYWTGLSVQMYGISAVQSRELGFVKRRTKAWSVKEQCRVTGGTYKLWAKHRSNLVRMRITSKLFLF